MAYMKDELTPNELDDYEFVVFSVLGDAQRHAESTGGALYTQVKRDKYIDKNGVERDRVFVKGEGHLSPDGFYAVIT